MILRARSINQIREWKCRPNRVLSRGIGRDAAIQSHQHHACRADPISVVPKSRKHRATVLFGDCFAQGIIEGKNLNVVAHAFGEHVELPHENRCRSGKLALSLFDEVAANDVVGEKRRQRLNADERADQEEREAFAKAHRALSNCRRARATSSMRATVSG